MPHVDLLIVGAGISGIGAACRLTRERPATTYAILEQRHAIGGTWDLFRYPGVRSDTDMYTYSYPFKPWAGATSMGDGDAIRAYLAEAAIEHDVERHIGFGTKVLGASWSSADARWTVRAETDGEPGTWTCSFVYLCAGYYDYDRAHQPDFPGLADYRGRFVHPQFWPEDLDYAGRRVVVIGSGATAITIVPAIAGDAAHVTMLQRSPSYIAALPAVDPIADTLRSRLPSGLAHRLLRIKNVLINQGVYAFSRRFPRQARALFRRGALSSLRDPAYVDTHFKPRYKPWEQRLAVAPDGDFYAAIRDGRASVVTDLIDRFVPEGIRLVSGETLQADVVVSATGLALKPLGGLDLAVDGERVDVGATVAYRAAMLSGVPNLAFCFGYTNNSWTLRADLSARFVCRLLRHMDRHGYSTAIPTVDRDAERRPFIADLTSGYITRDIGRFPAQGSHDPWLVRQNYLRDAAAALAGDVTRGLRFEHRAPANVHP